MSCRLPRGRTSPDFPRRVIRLGLLGWSAGVIALLMSLWACTSSGDETALSTTSTEVLQSTPEAATGDNTAPLTYRIGITEDITTDNFWAYAAFEPSIANSYLLEGKHAALFRTVAPTMQTVEDLADEAPARPTSSGTNWVVEQRIRPDVVWSDGVPVTAHDLAFSFGVVRDFELGGLWLDYFPASVVAIDALDDRRVRIVFDAEPGLALWPSAPGRAPFMPRHFWRPIVDEAKRTVDPAATLAATSGMGEPSTGPFVLSEREIGSHIIARSNERWHLAGATITFHNNGAVRVSDRQEADDASTGDPEDIPYLRYTVGPYVDEVLYRVFDSLDIASLTMERGEIDFVLNPAGLPQGIEERMRAGNEVEVARNPSNGFGFLGFNLRTSPSNEPGFRNAVECLINKQSVAGHQLSGRVEPLDDLILPANEQWASMTGSTACVGLSESERLSAAVTILADSGFSWEQEPVITEDATEPGVGLRTPEGLPVRQLELLAEDTEENPYAVPYATWIEGQAAELGIDLDVRRLPTNALLDRLFTESPDWQMAITAWDLGHTTIPTYLEALFASWNDVSSGGFNLTGYTSDEFDELAGAFVQTTNLTRAREIARQMNRLLLEDRPYIPLYTPNLTEAFRAEISFPFERVLGGLQALGGAPELVRIGPP